jgi:thiol-disulfide isomerase/thioredoxin
MATKAPAFSGKDVTTGKPFSLAEHAGEIVVVSFNGITWCGPCKLEAPVLESLWTEYKASIAEPRVQFVMVFYDGGDPSQIKKLPAALKEFGITMPVIVDDGIFSAYTPNTGVPQIFFVNPEQDICGNKMGAGGPADGIRAAIVQHIIDCGGSAPKHWKPEFPVPVEPVLVDWLHPVDPTDPFPHLEPETRDILLALSIDSLARSMIDLRSGNQLRLKALDSARSALSRLQLRVKQAAVDVEERLMSRAGAGKSTPGS